MAYCLPRDQRPGLLIAFSNEHPALDHQSVCLFSQIWLYLIKYLLQLELRRTCSTDGIVTIGSIYSNSLGIEPSQTVAQWAIKMSHISSHLFTAWSNYIPVFLTVM